MAVGASFPVNGPSTYNGSLYSYRFGSIPVAEQQQLSFDLNSSPDSIRVSARPQPVIARKWVGCVYCGAQATTKDHVPPRCLLEKPFPPGLLTIPSCEECNGDFSKDEQYLQIVLAQIGFKPYLMAKVEEGGVVDRALERAPALDERVIQLLEATPDGGVSFRPERERVLNIVRKIAFGLYFRRYRRRVSLEQFSAIAFYGPGDEAPPRVVAASHYRPGIRRKPWHTVQNGVFAYLFAKGWQDDDPPLYCCLNLHRTLLAVVACPDPRTVPRG